jgi:eukaryotic-like serine/threonine-protein kinase
MPAPSTTDDYLALVAKSDLLEPQRLEEFVARRRADDSFPDEKNRLALLLVNDGLLTRYQAEQLLEGRWRNFLIGGKYKLLERLGKGGMALVFLCEHKVMKRLVALKILPSAHSNDKEMLGRFHREARALSQLRHPNIVGAYDVDQANNVHFLVMEYVDGGDLEQVVSRAGPLAWDRSAHYVRQAAHGLQHAHDCGLVHRDVKPGNLLVDRAGNVKLLDLGLARIFHESTDDLTTGRDVQTLLGTVDYLAPEQALNSHDVDIRADIYGLGATFYFILTGKGLFEDGTVAQKLSWHLHRPPAPISKFRPDVPEGLCLIIDRMLAKRPEDRYQTPDEVVDALEPWTRNPIEPPRPEDFPHLSKAARAIGQPSSVRTSVPTIKSLSSNGPKPSEALSVPTKVIPAPTPSAIQAASVPPVEEVPAEPPPSAPSVPFPSAPPRRWMTRRNLAGMVAGLLVIGAGVLWAHYQSSEGEVAVSEPRKALTPPADQPADASVSLVSGSSIPQSFLTVREAIHAAKPGDRVVVRGTLLIEAVELSDAAGAPRDLCIEGINTQSQGEPVHWRGSRDLSGGRALLDVSSLEGFRLKGFLFDGQGKVAELLRVSGRGAGSVLEDLQFKGATRASVVLRGWAGESGKPATIERSSFSTESEPEAAILIEADPDRPTTASEFVRVLACRFVGPFQGAMVVSGAVNELDVEQCRFFRTIDGLRYRRTENRHPLRVRLANNTFVNLHKGLHFETTPPSGSSGLVVTNNVFAGTLRIAVLDKVSVQPSRPSAAWIWSEEGKPSGNAVPEVRQFRKTFEVSQLPDQATLDVGCDETFTVWINGVEVVRNPSPHFTQRVFSLDVTGQLRQGRNVLAVQGTNRLDRLDSKSGTSAALLAQITSTIGSREVVLIKTDETWKCGDQSPEGWTKPEFDDQSWTSARPWPDDGTMWPWKFAVWDSVVLPQLKPPLEPINVKAAGNVRDYKTWEGYPTIDSERVAIQESALPKNPHDDPHFLRYSHKHPLATAGPDNSPLGVFETK